MGIDSLGTFLKQKYLQPGKLKSNSVRVVFSTACLLIPLFCSSIFAATYDATGDWIIKTEPKQKIMGKKAPYIVFNGSIVQNGDVFILLSEGVDEIDSGLFSESGTVSGAVYVLDHKVSTIINLGIFYPGTPYEGVMASLEFSEFELISPTELSGAFILAAGCGIYQIVFEGINKKAMMEDSFCLSAKLKATGKLCSAYMDCYGKSINKSGYDKSTSLEKAGEKFFGSWDKAEDHAAKKELDCLTDAATAIEDIIFLALEDIYSQINNGIVDHNDKNSLKYGCALMKAVGKKCLGLLNAESLNAKKQNEEKKGDSQNKAADKFKKSWEKAQANAERKSVEYMGPDMDEVSSIIDDMIADVLNAMGL